MKDETVLEHTAHFRGPERLEYTLSLGERDGRDSYTIRAVQYKRGLEICSASAPDVSSVYENAKEMYDVISDGRVEPYLLCDVVCDLMP